MHIRRLIAATLCTLALPLSVNAADSVLLQQLLVQLQTLQAALGAGVIPSSHSQTNSCAVFLHVLRPGSTGDEVTRLQQYLASDSALYPEAKITGYYGDLTVAAIRRLQVLHGIIFEGTPETTGFGAVGTKTLTLLNTLACPSAPVTTFTVFASSTAQVRTNSTEGNSVLPKSFLGVTAPTGAGIASPQTNNSEGNSVSAKPAWIQVITSVSGQKIALGTGIFVIWTSTNAPFGATVRLALARPMGLALGTIESGQPSSGSTFWTLPQPSAPCTGTQGTCLGQFATPCSGELCAIAAGKYVIRVELVNDTMVVARDESAPFTITSTPPPVLSDGGDTLAQFAAQTASGTLPVSSNALENTLSSIPAFLGSLDASASQTSGLSPAVAPKAIPAAPLTNGACMTPWGSQRIQNGQEITYQPFFTGGTYTGTTINVLMLCTSGKWSKCNMIGDQCVSYSI